jgi:hypothetical protein
MYEHAAVGLKATPGPLYGFKKDMWAALAVAVTYERMLERGGTPGDDVGTG